MNTEARPRPSTEADHSTSASALPGSIRLWQAVSAAHAALTHELDADCAERPVLVAETFAVLLSLADEPGHQLRMRELAQRSHLTPSGLTRRVDRLESDGLVVRVGCPGDRRGAFAQATPRGLDELLRALPLHAAALERHVGQRLDAPGIDGLIALLEDLAGRPRMARPNPDPRTPVTTDRGR